MKRIFALFTALAMVFGLCACSAKVEEPTWQEQFDMGVRYLSEGEYEEAILAFTAAIEIDPKQVEAYEKLADAYLALGDVDSALTALQDGLTATGDESLQARIDNLTAPEATATPDPMAEPTDDPSQLRPLQTDLKFEEVTLMGHSVRNLDAWTMKAVMEENGIEASMEDDGFGFYYIKSDIQSKPYISALQEKDEDHINMLNYSLMIYDDGYVERSAAMGIRDIHLGDTMETVLTQLGASNVPEAVSYIEDVAARSYEDPFDIPKSLYGVLARNFSIGSPFFSLGSFLAPELDDGSHRLYELTMEIGLLDSTSNSYYNVNITFRRESDSQFVGYLTDCSVHVHD